MLRYDGIYYWADRSYTSIIDAGPLDYKCLRFYDDGIVLSGVVADIYPSIVKSISRDDQKFWRGRFSTNGEDLKFWTKSATAHQKYAGVILNEGATLELRLVPNAEDHVRKYVFHQAVGS
jgi:hypothetical protein